MTTRHLRHIAPLLLLAVATTTHAADPTPTKSFPHPDRIRYDSQCLTIDNKDLLIYSGAFHYFRCPKELWHDRFTKLKEAGFNTVESYIAWNAHEKEMPASLDDYSKVDLTDADDWITMAESFGFYVIIRPGPYICAEWDHGGFPSWLVNKRPAHPKEPEWFRSDDPDFLAWSKHWLHAVSPMIAKHQITRKPPGSPGVILFQLENEYNYAAFSDAIKSAYVKSLAEDATADGIDVPLFTCWTKQIRGNTNPVLRTVFDSCNFYTGWNVDKTLSDVDKLRKEQQDAPLMTTELQGGWFTTGLGAPPIRPDADTYRPDLGPNQINNLTLLEWSHGETLTNYYMAFGGTNFGDTAAKNISTSYDYSAPIRECGGTGEKYLVVKALGQFIHNHGAQLARATEVQITADTGSPDVSVVERRAQDGARFFFIRTSQHDQPRKGTVKIADLSIPYDLEPFGSKVFYIPANASQGEWLLKPVPAPERPTNLPAPITITDIHSAPVSPASLTFHPADNKSLNELAIYDSRFVFYKATLHVTAEDLQKNPHADLVVEHPAVDALLVSLNNQPLPAAPDSGDTTFPTTSTLHAGDNTVLLLYENAGTPNGGIEMEKRAGIFNLHLAPAADNASALSSWRMKIVARNAQAEKLPELAADFNDADWATTKTEARSASQLKGRQDGVFRTTVQLSDADLKSGRTSLTFSRCDDRGVIYLNGQKLADAPDWAQSYTFDAAKLLHPGNNSLAVLVHNTDGNGGLGAVTLAHSAPPSLGTTSDLTFAPVPAPWEQPASPSTEKSDNPFVTTERLTFTLPTPDPHTWVPLLLRLHATGNGFLALNGHPLGRTWQQGKQSDFYLPECWLNPGSTNTLTLSLRAVDKPITIESAQILPYTIYAEKR